MAQDYPTRPVKIIVPFGAGGPADVDGAPDRRSILQEGSASPSWSRTAGAGGVIGTVEVAKSPPDGYTLLMMSNTQTVNEIADPDKQLQTDARSGADRAGQLLRTS